MAHTFSARVYLEDVDAAGIVYHANHLKYAERARTELLAAGGLRHVDVMATGTVIVVKTLFIDYVAPLKLEEDFRVESRVTKLGGASATMEQIIHGPAGLCARLEVVLVHTQDGKSARWSDALRQILA
jgi:acyl-CoA thioester hydrolase